MYPDLSTLKLVESTKNVFPSVKLVCCEIDDIVDGRIGTKYDNDALDETVMGRSIVEFRLREVRRFRGVDKSVCSLDFRAAFTATLSIL